jgi:transcriptional regulator with XRE-family HTH domain
MSINISSYVGKRLKLRRQILCLSRKDVGDIIGVSSQQIQKYESGLSSLGSCKLFNLAIALDVEPGYFFIDLPRKDHEVFGSDLTSALKCREGIDDPMLLMNHEEIMRLIRLYLRIKDSKVRERLLDFLEGITKTSATGPNKASIEKKCASSG